MTKLADMAEITANPTNRVYLTNSTGTLQGWGRLDQVPGFVNADVFSTVAELVTYCEANTPLTVKLGRGVYDFTGLTVPVGVTFEGVGLVWNGSASRQGFGENGSIITGAPLQQQGSSHNRFVGVVFDGGFTVRKQLTVFEYCAFVNGALTFEGESAAPYYSTVDKCVFRGTSSASSIIFRHSANAINITNCQILVGSGQRGLEAVAVGSAVPVTVNVTNCGLETSESSIGSFVYGDFTNSTFNMNYLDAVRPTFTDGAAVVLTGKSRTNRVWLANNTGDTYTDSGLYNQFYGGAIGTVYSNVSGFDMGTRSGIPELYILGVNVATGTLPSVTRAHSRMMRVSSVRTGGSTLSAASGETVNGSANIVVGKDEIYLFYGAQYFGPALTNWTAVRIG